MNRRLNYDRPVVRITNTSNLKFPDELKLARHRNYFITVETNLDKIRYIRSKGKILTLRSYIGKAELQRYVRTYRIPLSQLKQLKDVIYYINTYNEVFNIGSVIQLLKAGQTTQFVRRLRFIHRIRSSNGILQFITVYGLTKGIAKWNAKKDSFSGRNNPGYQHGGTLSSLSKKSMKYKGLSEEEMRDQISRVKNSIRETKGREPHRRGGGNVIGYWTHKGYSLEQAQMLVRERQATGRLDRFVQRYGEVEGTRRWEQRQIRWQNTLKSKPLDEIVRINQLKGTGSNAGYIVQRIHNDPQLASAPSILYYLRIYNDETEFYKIGITSYDVVARFGSLPVFERRHKLQYDVIYEQTGTFTDCFIQEQKILKRFKDKRISINYNGFKTTEAFSEDVLSPLYLLGVIS